MSTVWKVIIALALVLPIGAFVAGSLMSSSADEPTDRDPVILREAPQEKSSKPACVRLSDYRFLDMCRLSSDNCRRCRENADRRRLGHQGGSKCRTSLDR